MLRNIKTQVIIFSLFCALSTHAQVHNVLFIGNSYTGRNNLPQLVQDVALSTGDTLNIDRHTPGGARFMTHAANATVMNKINAEDWDYVVLQAQSQEPSFPDFQVQQQLFPYATTLCDMIRENNPCTQPVFYMTWGRENGDAQNCAAWPPVCTYEGMDSLLSLRYRMMSDDNDGYVSPVGAVWHYIREHHPAIQLYAGDGSHPSRTGSYAAACTFYAIILQKDPTLIQHTFSLPDTTVAIIQRAAKVVAFDSLRKWNVGAFNPIAKFTYSQDKQTVDFVNNSSSGDSYFWDFGDSTTSTDKDPTHHYNANGEYTVRLIVTRCGVADTTSTKVSISSILGIDIEVDNTNIRLFPNPTNDLVTVTGIPRNSTIVIVNKLG